MFLNTDDLDPDTEERHFFVEHLSPYEDFLKLTEAFKEHLPELTPRFIDNHEMNLKVYLETHIQDFDPDCLDIDYLELHFLPKEYADTEFQETCIVHLPFSLYVQMQPSHKLAELVLRGIEKFEEKELLQ